MSWLTFLFLCMYGFDAAAELRIQRLKLGELSAIVRLFGNVIFIFIISALWYGHRQSSALSRR